jgi:hypothetical protein
MYETGYVPAAMADDRVEDVRDFKWESQMRYTWEYNEAPPSGTHPQVSKHPHHKQGATVGCVPLRLAAQALRVCALLTSLAAEACMISRGVIRT